MIANMSRLFFFQECRRKVKFQYQDGLAPNLDAPPLILGGAAHEGLAEFLANRDPEKAVQLTEDSFRKRLEGAMILPEERPKLEQDIQIARRLVRLFCDNYSDSDMQVLWPEVEFCVSIPRTEHHCLFFHKVLHPDETSIGCSDPLCFQPIYFQGKTDAVVQWKGPIWLHEHKTTSYTGDIFYDRFFLDIQPTGYLYGIGKAMGVTPHGFILNVLKKPTKNKKDQLDVKIERETYLRTDEDLKEFEQDFIMIAQDYEEAFLRQRFYCNTKSCTAWNRRCYFWEACKNNGTINPDLYRQRDMDYVDSKYYELLGLPVPEKPSELKAVEEV